jgi:hypothetical protein
MSAAGVLPVPSRGTATPVVAARLSPALALKGRAFTAAVVALMVGAPGPLALAAVSWTSSESPACEANGT